MYFQKINIMSILTAAPGTEPETQQELRKVRVLWKEAVGHI